MERDLRETPLYQEIEAAYRRLAEPGFGRITAASDVRASPDGRTIAFRGARLDALEGRAERPHLPGRRGRLGHTPGHARPQRRLRAALVARWPTLSFLSDRALAGSAQLYALERDVLGEARRLTEAPGSVEHHEWSPDGTRILLLVAGHGAEQTDALGSGTLGPEAELPSWVPPSTRARARARARRALYVLEVASGELRQASPDEQRLGSGWCGDDAIVAIVSEGAGEGAWYRAELALIDPVARTARTLRHTDVQLGWVAGVARRPPRGGGRGGLQRSRDRRRRPAADRPRLG